MVKNPPAVQETKEHPLEEGTAAHSSTLAWEIPGTEVSWQVTVHGVTKSQTQLSDFHFWDFWDGV